MQLRHVLVALALGGGTITGCVRRGATAPANGGHEVILLQELERSKELTLYDAVAKLRPNFLRNRSYTAHGRNAGRQMMLYVDGEKMESIDDLRRFTPSQVQEVRFYEPQIANTVFGRYNNYGGAVAVILKKLDG